MAPSVNKNQTSTNVSLSYLAIVSPCSTCKNQLAVANGNKPACPRRKAQAAQQEFQQNQFSSTVGDPLALTGNEDNPDASGSTGLVNPVYSTKDNSILVWVAAVKDNVGLTDNKGNVIYTDLMDPNFDTTYITCKVNPVTPEKNEADYFQAGAWAEWDQVNVDTLPTMQTIKDPNQQGTTTSIPVEGTAKKLNMTYYAPRAPINRDFSSPGT
jgi:hypothetical protein